MIDRETLLRCLDLAVRLNDDGEAETAMRTAGALAEWIEQRLAAERGAQVRRLDTGGRV
jgi:hypothetical protein